MSVFHEMERSQSTNTKDRNSQHWAYLMCPPDHFEIGYEINPWMTRDVQPDPELAREQWNNLVANLKKAGASVDILHPVASLPDMVFTADIGLTDGQRFIKTRFRHPVRQPEIQYGVDWLQNHNYEIVELPLPNDIVWESSDVRPFRNYLIGGHGFRTDIQALRALAGFTQRKLLPIEFVDPRFYHLDLSFCPLGDRRAIVAPDAWSRSSCELIKEVIPELLVLELDEALTFCSNAVIVDKTIIMPACPPRVGRVLERWGYTVCVSPVSEFLKAGGAVHCLTLALHDSFSLTKKESV